MLFLYLVDGWRHPEDFPARVDEDIALVSDFVVAVGAARSKQRQTFKIRSVTFSFPFHCDIAHFVDLNSIGVVLICMGEEKVKGCFLKFHGTFDGPTVDLSLYN
jgi:hypothetical protein